MLRRVLSPILCAALLGLSGFSLAQTTTPSAAQSAWKLLHDPFQAVPYPQATAAEKALITKAGRKAGFKGSQREETKGQLFLEGRITGPFLLKGTPETALLYGDGFQEQALLILRNGQPVLHLQLLKASGMAALSEAYALKDIDGDGLRELVLVQGYEDGGLSKWLTILNFAGVARGGLPKVSATYRTAQMRCEIALVNGKEGTLGQERRYRLWVLPGRSPQFRADEWGSNTCGDKTPKLLRQGMKPVVLTDVTEGPKPARLPLP